LSKSFGYNEVHSVYVPESKLVTLFLLLVYHLFAFTNPKGGISSSLNF